MNKEFINRPGIYKIVNKRNGKVYYGSATTTFKIRWRQHKNDLMARRHRNNRLQRAWIKYGSNNFVFNIVLLCAKEHCLYYEQLFLNKYYDDIDCYNICPIAGNTSGRKHTEVTKKILSEKARLRKTSPMSGRLHGQKTKNMIALANTGKIHTLEWRKDKSLSMMGTKNQFYGKSHNDKTRQIISSTHVGKIPWNKGIKRTDEEKTKISVTRQLTGCAIGSKNPNSKYTEEQIIATKKLIKNGFKNKEISIKTGVSINTIERVKANKTWQHIKILEE